MADVAAERLLPTSQPPGGGGGEFLGEPATPLVARCIGISNRIAQKPTKEGLRCVGIFRHVFRRGKGRLPEKTIGFRRHSCRVVGIQLDDESSNLFNQSINFFSKRNGSEIAF